MGDTYERVQEKAGVMRFRELAGLLLEVESFIPHSWLRRASIGYLLVARPKVSPEEQERGEQWKGFAGEIRREIRLAAQTQQKHMEETFTAKLTHIEKTTAANFSRIEETTAANFSRIEA